jgi:hypothetical protein
MLIYSLVCQEKELWDDTAINEVLKVQIKTEHKQEHDDG